LPASNLSVAWCARVMMRAIDGCLSASFAARADDAFAVSAASSPMILLLLQRFRWSFTSLRRSSSLAAFRPRFAPPDVCDAPKSTWSRQAASRARPRCATPARAFTAPQRWSAPARLDECGGHATLEHRGDRVRPQVEVREQKAVAMVDREHGPLGGPASTGLGGRKPPGSPHGNRADRNEGVMEPGELHTTLRRRRRGAGTQSASGTAGPRWRATQ